MQKRPPSQQMSRLFHHSLIKVIVSYQLEQQGIPWDIFITHDDFTTSPSIPLQILPSISQNPPHTPPSPSTDLGSSSSHESLSQTNLLHTPSPKKYDHDENTDDHEERRDDHDKRIDDHEERNDDHEKRSKGEADEDKG